jgi:hypothetical protein
MGDFQKTNHRIPTLLANSPLVIRVPKVPSLELVKLVDRLDLFIPGENEYQFQTL